MSGPSAKGAAATPPSAAGSLEANAGRDALDTEVPVVRIVTGNATDVELAAVHAVIVAALADQAAAGVPLLEPRVDGWLRSARTMRGSHSPGAGAWTASRGLRGC